MLEQELKHIPIVFTYDWFHSGYFVYVITIHHKTKGIYYYVGQTGDRNHKAARSPFYNLMGHFRPYKSTDNQLVVGLVSNGLINLIEGKSTRVCVEEAIFSKAIEVKSDYFKIDEFDTKDHKTKTQYVEAIELEIINYLNQKKKKIFNDLNKIGSKKVVADDDAKKIASKIIASLEL